MKQYSLSRLGRVTVESGYATLLFERHLPHSPETVWNAITDPSQLAHWYMTKGTIVGGTGGTIEFWSGPSQLHVTGNILVWDQPHILEHEWNVEPRPELPKGERAVIRWELIPEGEETILKLAFRNLTQRTSQGYAPGMHAFLDRLESLLTKVPMPDFRERVEELRESYPGWSSSKQ